MQKVEGSSPFIRSKKGPGNGAFLGPDADRASGVAATLQSDCKEGPLRLRRVGRFLFADKAQAVDPASELFGGRFKVCEAERVILLDRLESGRFAPAAIGQKLG